MKRIIFITVIMFLAFDCFGMDNTDSSTSNTQKYDTSVFNISMSEPLEATKEILKTYANSDDFSKEDKWQGYIDNNWNVPVYSYGTTLNCDDKLVVNGEDLGTLQNLMHFKKAVGNGIYDKAVFEYNGYVYYVIGLNLSTQDDLDHVIVTARENKSSKDFSDFMFWYWKKGPDGNIYKYGNVGYAYTLRNVKMQDGSYVTITIAGYNYNSYGLRVWIKPSTGSDVKVDYPEKNAANTSEDFPYKSNVIAK